MTSHSLADITETPKGNNSEPPKADRKIRRYSTSKDVHSINSEANILRRTTAYSLPDQNNSVFTTRPEQHCIHHQTRTRVYSPPDQNNSVFTTRPEQQCIHYQTRTTVYSPPDQNNTVFTTRPEQQCIHHQTRTTVYSPPDQNNSVFTTRPEPLRFELPLSPLISK